jgi:medium-chain acyl-[acyl-carrier-protein] hydrolase
MDKQMKSPSDHTPWLIRGTPNAGKRLRLFCFPYAGGGASIFRLWRKDLFEDINVCAVQLPGRENRIAEQLYNKLTDLIKAMAEDLEPYLDVPFAFFGHSLGAKIAFEFAREIRRRRGIQPVHIFLSGSRPVHIPEPRPLHRLPDQDFIAALERYAGTPASVLQNSTFMELYLPILRADFSIDETYAYYDEPPLNCPITAFAGNADKGASIADQKGWRQHTSRAFTIHTFQGDHFFIKSARPALLDYISRILAQYIR